jgi:hypothetical protein
LNYFLRITVALRREAVTKRELGGQAVHATTDFMGAFYEVTGLGGAGNWRKNSGENCKLPSGRQPTLNPNSQIKMGNAGTRCRNNNRGANARRR